ncbi:MAG TPA: O-methyltransferase [Chitinophagales bacterium]|nr:O-methyltransferase [Chitinophagales bacterium]
MEFPHPDINRYAGRHTTPESDVLKRLNRETHLHVLMPQMLSGHLQGSVLKMISRMLRPRRVLEIGTFTGYAAICLADGLTEDGKLITIDVNEELHDMATRFVAEAGLQRKIDALVGDAMAIIPTLDETFDLVFIDADKINYANYYDLVFDKVRPGGLLVADNVLWSGKVLEEKKDKDTQAIDAFNKKIAGDPRVETALLPVRDGLMLIWKKF